MDRTIMDSKVVSGIMDFNERKAKMTEKNIEVLDKVKEILTLGNTDLMTVQMVADYYEVGIEAIQSLIKRNRKELESNGMNTLTSKEIKKIFGMSNTNIPSYRWGFEYEGQRFNNRGNILLTKRTLLNIGMLLRDSKVAQELRKRILDIVYDAEEGNGSVETVVSEIDEEMQITQEMTKAIYEGDVEKESLLKTRIIALRNKRIKELEDDNTHKGDVIDGFSKNISLQEKRQRISQIVRKGGYEYAERWGLLYSEFEKKYHMNLNKRMKSYDGEIKINNKIDYIDKVEHMIPELYDLAVKLFESDVNKIVDEIKNVTNREAM